MNEELEMAEMGRQDYGVFITQCLDVPKEFFWPKMKVVADSVRDNERTAVGAGHGVSKTFNAARIVLTFLYCYYPSTVVTLAPSGLQVKNLMWREIREAYTNARIPLGGKMTTIMLDMQPETGKIWYATGISTRPDTVTQEATRLQGIHNEHVLVILDEAAGIMPEIWRAIQYIGAPFKRILAIGNPTSKFGDFPAALKDPTWNHIQISVKDTPNFKTGKQIIPGVYGREFERQVRLKYGEDSDEYRVRVDGGISQKGALGAYYSRKIDELRKKGRISDIFEHNPNYPVHIIEDVGYTTAVGFVQVIEGQSTFINYYEDSGLSIEKYVELFDAYKKQFGYRYGEIIVPCDMDSNATTVITGQTALDTMRGFDYKVKPLPRESRVNEGIQRTLKYLDTCRFHKTRCARLLECLEGYHEAINKQMTTEDTLVTKGFPCKDEGFDHGCLIAGTLIKTIRGQIPIEQVKTGDIVITSWGKEKVLAAGKVKDATSLIHITTNSGRKLIMTPEHQVFSDFSLVRSGMLSYNSILFKNGFLRNILWNILKQLNLMGTGIGFRDAITKGWVVPPEEQYIYTGLFGNFIRGLFRKVMRYTTKTATALTMILQISNVCRWASTSITTQQTANGLEVKQTKSSFGKQVRKQKSGIAAKKVEPGIVSAPKNIGQISKCTTLLSANVVARNTRHHSQNGRSFAQTNVNQKRGGVIKKMMKQGLALFVVRLIRLINTVKPERVVKIVVVNYQDKPEPVYDLTIEKDHCYYANDLLVSNCDMLRYASMAVKRGLSGTEMTAEESREIWQKHIRQ